MPEFRCSDVKFGVPIPHKNLGVVADADMSFGQLILFEYAIATTPPAAAAAATATATATDASTIATINKELIRLASEDEQVKQKLLQLYAGTLVDDETPIDSRVKQILWYNSFGLER